MTNTYQADYYRQHAERLNAYSRAYNDKLREMTVPHATRTGEPWTDADDRFLLADDGLHVYEKALQLRRTARACYEHRRHLLRNAAPTTA